MEKSSAALKIIIPVDQVRHPWPRRKTDGIVLALLPTVIIILLH